LFAGIWNKATELLATESAIVSAPGCDAGAKFVLLKALYINDDNPKSIVEIRKKLYKIENVIIKLNKNEEGINRLQI